MSDTNTPNVGQAIGEIVNMLAKFSDDDRARILRAVQEVYRPPPVTKPTIPFPPGSK